MQGIKICVSLSSTCSLAEIFYFKNTTLLGLKSLIWWETVKPRESNNLSYKIMGGFKNLHLNIRVLTDW